MKDAPRVIDWYVDAFGAKDRGRFTDPSGMIMHAEVMIGDSIVMLAEEMPEMGTRGPTTLGGTPVSLCIYTDDADALFNRATTAGATVLMPLADKKDLSVDEMKQAVAEMFAHQQPA